MLFPLFAFGVLISLVSLVAAFHAAGDCLRARHASNECHGQVHGKRVFKYSSVDRYQGGDFLNDKLWAYFTWSDPTGGQVKYLSRAEAQENNLAYVQGDNKTVLRVDSWTNLSPGAPRNSVRISSVKTFKHGLVIADFDHMPFGCSVWPAFWTVGPQWPNNGEIDIVEGVNNKQMNQYTFHTGANIECNVPRTAPIVHRSPAFTGMVLNTNCSSAPSSDIGCTFLDTSNSSFGQGFATVGGGVFALLRNSNGFKIWHFERQSIPHDVSYGDPDPYSWPTPIAFLSADNCDIESFSPQWLVLDITLCGGWANSDYPNSGCPATCTQQVTTGNNFVDAKWLINSITVYNS